MIDADGQYLIPGMIDDQVHFREPGLTHKATIETESKAAVAGGITSFIEMPNTVPQATTIELLEEKFAIAKETSWANYSFMFGGTNDNLDEILKVDPSNVAGLKLFLGSSTGNMLVDNPKTLENIFSKTKLLISAHCEDEATIQKNLAKYKAIHGDDIPIDPAHYRKLKKANVEGTANIVNLCLSHGIKKLAYVSSVATLGDAVNGKMISEDTHWNPEGENSVYAITKFGAEMEVWRGTQEGLNAVIVNPGVILGSGYWNSGSGSIIKTASKGIPFYFGGGIGIVDVKDVVRILLQLMKEEITGQRYVLVSANVPYKKLLSAIANNAGKSPPKKEAPKWILYFLSGLDWLAAVLFGSKRRLLKATVRSMYTDTAYDASKIRNELKYKFIRFEDTIERVVKNYSSEVSSGSVS